jgi:methionyl-tRNA synthetase
VSWGIEVPFSPDHVVYVWIDALFNNITVPGYHDDQARFQTLWPADIHFIGKDILRHHALYWPIMLHALGLPDEQMPRMVFAHGWWKIGEQKMSKSLGNIVDPTVVVTKLLAGQPYAADVYRYFLLREVPFGQDGSFSEDAIFIRLNADLANDLGNLVNRTCSMIERYCGGRIPSPGPGSGAPQAGPEAALWQEVAGLHGVLERTVPALEFSAALEAIMAAVAHANQYIEAVAPWKLAKDPGAKPRLDLALYLLASVVAAISAALAPFMPSVAPAIWTQLGCAKAPAVGAVWGALPQGQALGPHPVLFPRIDAAKAGA